MGQGGDRCFWWKSHPLLQSQRKSHPLPVMWLVVIGWQETHPPTHTHPTPTHTPPPVVYLEVHQSRGPFLYILSILYL